MSKQNNLNYHADFDLLMHSGDIALLEQYLETNELQALPDFLNYTFMDLCQRFEDSKEYKRCFAYILNRLEDQGKDLDFTNNRGQTALMLLSQGSHSEQMKSLLNKSIDINKTDNNNENALFYCLNNKEGFDNCLKLLMSFDIDLNAQNISKVS